MTIAIEAARDAAQTDAAIDAAHALVRAAGTYTAALLALAGIAGSVGDGREADVIERAAGEMARCEVDGRVAD